MHSCEFTEVPSPENAQATSLPEARNLLPEVVVGGVTDLLGKQKKTNPPQLVRKAGM